MKKTILTLLTITLMTVIFATTTVQAENHYAIKTNKGTIEIKTDAENAPDSAANFDKYVADKFYDGTIFHRVINGFMIQGGGFTKDMKEKTTCPAIKNEAKTQIKNLRGTLAMARTSEINSAASQFFINVADNEFLNHKDEKQYGYAVFGSVTKGMEVVDAIKAVPTGNKNGMGDVPNDAVVIESIRKIDAATEPSEKSEVKTKPTKKANKKKD